MDDLLTSYISQMLNTMNKQKNATTVTEHLHAVSLELTFASLHALKPPVIDISVACTSAVLEPSTARSTTTHSAGFAERAAHWACHRISDRWGGD